jgi:hypothetical protein
LFIQFYTNKLPEAFAMNLEYPTLKLRKPAT